MIVEFLDEHKNVIGGANIGNQPHDRFVGQMHNGSLVSIVREVPDYRAIRDDVFSKTIDRMNVVRYNHLSEDQKARLEAWRQEWLDYPESKVEPNTDVSDIF